MSGGATAIWHQLMHHHSTFFGRQRGQHLQRKSMHLTLVGLRGFSHGRQGRFQRRRINVFPLEHNAKFTLSLTEGTAKRHQRGYRLFKHRLKLLASRQR
jgi:hypothetical protein